MKKTRTRLWSILLTVAMLLTLLPATALAAETPNNDMGISYSFEQALREAKAFVYGSLQEAVMIGESLPAMYPPVEDSLKLISLEKL